MIPEDQMVVVFMNDTKKPRFTGRLAIDDNSSPLARGGYEKIQIEKARYILKFFADHNSGERRINYEYTDGITQPGGALIATHYLDKDKWGISVRTSLSEDIDYYFIGYAARSLGSYQGSNNVSKFIFPYKYLDMFIKCIEPYFNESDYVNLKASIELSFKLKDLGEGDASAIANL